MERLNYGEDVGREPRGIAESEAVGETHKSAML